MSRRADHRYHVFSIDGGFCGIAWSDSGITRFQLPTGKAETTERLLLRRTSRAKLDQPPSNIMRVIAFVRGYFQSEKVDFSEFQLDLADQSELFIKIYEAARKVGWGQTTTYGMLAKDLGESWELARDVGQAMSKNPVPLIIPCHRVLAAGNKIGGFSAPGGAMSKARMLALEGTLISSPTPKSKATQGMLAF